MNSRNPLKNIARFGLIIAASAVSLIALPAKADLLELTNGDHYRGTVISMTRSNIEFQSEIQGLVKLPRNKVAQITFREPAISHPAVVMPPATSATTNAPLILAGPIAAPANPGDAVVTQMRQQGIDPKIVNQVQEQIFGKASPEAAQKFNETMDGLLSGKLNIQDIRAQAVNSIGQIKAARKELGDDAGDMLDGYLAILEKFVQETGPAAGSPASLPPASTPPAAAPAPSK